MDFSRRTVLRGAFLLAAVASLGCAGVTGSGDSDPEWVTALIRGMEAEPVANPPARVVRYEYGGRTVYYVPPRCCDIASTLYDASGTVVCHPDGGFTGRGDGRCPDFIAERRNEKIIWRDSRT